MNKKDFTKYALDVINNYSPALNLRKYKNEIKYNKKNSEILFTNSYENICEYVEKNLFSQYIYNYISCTETEDYYEIKNETPHISYCQDCTSWPALEDVKFSIKLPIFADENNADYVKNKTYTWEFNKDTSDEKSLFLKISKTSLKSNKNKEIKTENTKVVVKKSLLIIMILLIIGIIALITKGLYKKYQENKIEY